MNFQQIRHQFTTAPHKSLWIALTIMLLAGCNPEPTPPPATKTTPATTTPQENPIDENAVGEFVLDQNQFQQQFPTAENETVTPQRIYRPANPAPDIASQAIENSNYRRYESKHLILFTDIEPKTAEQLTEFADQEYQAWLEYFGPLPDARDGSDFRMIGYLMRDMNALVERDLVPREYLGMRTGGHKQAEFWMLDQETDYYRRHLLFHEATHCFMTIMPDTILPKWYLEGMAELLATHRINVDGDIDFRVLPENKEQYAGWGRIKTIQEDVAAGRIKTISQIRAIQRIDPVDEVRDYAWSWALCYFLDAHPRYQDRFRSLRDHWRSNAFTREFDRLYADDLSEMNIEWLLFVSSIIEGYDLPLAAVEFSPSGSDSQSSISAHKGWQSTGWQITSGETYHLTATGDVILATDPKPWVSHPNGITLEYFDKKPIGRLTGIIIAPSMNQIPELIDIGKETTWTANTSGTLFLRINDAWNSLNDNSRRYQVELE